MMRLPLPIDAAWRSGERRTDLALAGVLAAAALLLALRIYCALTLAMNSDEPQHLHVVWAWAQGLLPYRDVFDNHAPLFQLLCAPLLAWLGERADIVALMRLAMIPIYFGALVLTWLIGKTLWSPRVGMLAAGLAATAPVFFIVSVQFRPDDLWMLLWLAAVAVAIEPRLARHRAALLGLVVGTALAVSLKTLLLIAAAGIAWLTVVAIDGGLRELASRRFARTLGVGVACALVVPAAFAAFFVGEGVWREAFYCMFQHNVVPELDDRIGLRTLIPLLGYPLAIVAAFAWRRRARDVARWRTQSAVLFATLLYLLFLYGFWPLVTHQDLLPAIPLVAVGAAAVVFRGSGIAPAHRGLGALFAAICLVNLATDAVPRHNELADEANELARVLRLTRPDDYVMDAKGEMIFRRRPVYWAMENITVARMRDASIEDDIAERLAATGTPVVIMDRLPPRDAAFVERNYIPIGPAGGPIRVAGQHLGRTRARRIDRVRPSRVRRIRGRDARQRRRRNARWRAVRRRQAPRGRAAHVRCVRGQQTCASLGSGAAARAGRSGAVRGHRTMTKPLTFKAADRLLVFAPHPDDETLATGELIQLARESGAAVRVVFGTDGDNNPWPQRWCERRWRIGPAERERWGRRRRAEAKAALARLGVASEAVRFLGWSDLGLTDTLIRDDTAVETLRDEIQHYAPTHVAMPSLRDRHPDHGALRVMLELALAKARVSCVRLSYVVHGRDADARCAHAAARFRAPCAQARSADGACEPDQPQQVAASALGRSARVVRAGRTRRVDRGRIGRRHRSAACRSRRRSGSGGVTTCCSSSRTASASSVRAFRCRDSPAAPREGRSAAHCARGASTSSSIAGCCRSRSLAMPKGMCAAT